MPFPSIRLFRSMTIGRYLNAFLDHSPKVQYLTALSPVCSTESPKYTMTLIETQVSPTPLLLKINKSSLTKNYLYASVLLSQQCAINRSNSSATGEVFLTIFSAC